MFCARMILKQSPQGCKEIPDYMCNTHHIEFKNVFMLAYNDRYLSYNYWNFDHNKTFSFETQPTLYQSRLLLLTITPDTHQRYNLTT